MPWQLFVGFELIPSVFANKKACCSVDEYLYKISFAEVRQTMTTMPPHLVHTAVATAKLVMLYAGIHEGVT